MAPLINIFIQARMSSSRFPGKVLAPFQGKPLIKHVIESAKRVNNVNQVVVLTSHEESDDPLIAYLEKINTNYFRGSLNNVFFRFKAALKVFPCEYFVRLCADSPVINSHLIESCVGKLKINNYDIISNVINRTYPKGQSIEIIKAQVFEKIDENTLSAEQKEHVLPYFYQAFSNFSICSIENKINQSNINLCVDTVEDLKQLSHFSEVLVS